MSMGLGAPKRGKPRIVSHPLPTRRFFHSLSSAAQPTSTLVVSADHQRAPKKLGPETSMKDTWAKLSTAIKEIQNHNASKLSFEEHYRYAYNMVLFKRE